MKKYIIPFLIPVLCFILILVANGIVLGRFFPLWGDAQYQYYPLLIYLKDVFLGKANAIYSFQVGLSFPMLSTICYYLLSPFNLLILLFKNVEFFAVISIAIRIGLCGLTAYLYLNYQKTSKYTLVFSTAYALSAYVMHNYYQVMWLDSYFLAPLLLLGIDKLIKEKKVILYSVILFLIILTNYYMGYMCAIFSVIYFIYKYIQQKDRNKKTIYMFLIVSILSGLMTMFIQFPNFLQIIDIERCNSRKYLFNFNFIEILSKTFLGSVDTFGKFNEYSPYLYVGIFNTILLIFYFVNGKISKKEKVLSGIVLLIYALSIFLVPLNNFWHALSNPIGFNFRYAYLFNLFIISLCYKAFLNIEHVDKKYYYVICLLFILSLNLMIIFKKINIIYIYINVVLMLFYIFIMMHRNKDMEIVFVMLVLAELFFNGYSILHNCTLTYRYYIDGVYNEKQEALSLIDDNSFYRTEFNKKYAFNDTLHYGYYGTTGWLSSIYIDEDFYSKIGYFSANNTGYYSESIVLDSLLGIKYYDSTYDISYYDVIGKHSVSTMSNALYGVSYYDSYMYRNPYALSLGYMVNENVKNDFNCGGFDCQRMMMNHMIGYDNDAYEIDDELVIKNNKDFYVIISEPIRIDMVYSVCIMDKCYEINATSNRSIFIKNNYNIGDEITIKSENETSYFYVAYINYDNFINNYNELKANQLEIEEFKESYIKGKVTVDDNKVLFLSMPYNDNFIIKVDGKKTNYYKIFDYFVGLDLDSGEHTIEIEYKTKGVIPGVCISSISLVTLVFYIKKKKYY